MSDYNKQDEGRAFAGGGGQQQPKQRTDVGHPPGAHQGSGGAAGSTAFVSSILHQPRSQQVSALWWPKQEPIGGQSFLPSVTAVLPLKFLLSNRTMNNFTFDSPTRTWNGYLFGTRNNDGTPSMSTKSNYTPVLRPKHGEKLECESPTSQTIEWSDSYNGWILREATPTDSAETPQFRLREILKHGKFKPTHARLKAEYKSTSFEIMCNVLKSTRDVYRKKLSGTSISASGARGPTGGAPAATGPRKRVVCHQFHDNFMSQVSLSASAKIEHHEVAETSFCLWTALYEAMVVAKVPDLFGESDALKVDDQWDKQKVKDQCLGYMQTHADGEKKSSVTKDEFANMDFEVFSRAGMPSKPFDDYFEVSL
jgi:hypothetical protein